METRRTFLQACAAVSALPLAGLAAPALALAPGAGLYRLVADLDTPAGRAFAKEARRLGAPAATPSRAVSALWSDDLSDRWKTTAAPIAGLTDHNTWFVLDMMASGAGLRTIYQAHHVASARGERRHEVFGPHAMLEHRAMLEAANGGWAARAARAVVGAPRKASLARTQSTVLAAQDRMLGPGDLVSWVIAAPVRS
jgi:hypothetical protein